MVVRNTAFVDVACWRSCKWRTPQVLPREANDAHDNRCDDSRFAYLATRHVSANDPNPGEI
jgi:hypothetical protein